MFVGVCVVEGNFFFFFFFFFFFLVSKFRNFLGEGKFLCLREIFG